MSETALFHQHTAVHLLSCKGDKSDRNPNECQAKEIYDIHKLARYKLYCCTILGRKKMHRASLSCHISSQTILVDHERLTANMSKYGLCVCLSQKKKHIKKL